MTRARRMGPDYGRTLPGNLNIRQRITHKYVKRANAEFRLYIKASRNPDEISDYVEQSKFIVENAEGGVRDRAIKELEKTARTADHRIDNMETTETQRAVSGHVAGTGASVSWGKKKMRLP